MLRLQRGMRLRLLQEITRVVFAAVRNFSGQLALVISMKSALTQNKQKALIAIKKAISSAESVKKMIEDDIYCPTTIQQVSAVEGLLKSVRKNLLCGHLCHCIETRFHEDKDKTVTELLEIYQLGSK